MTDGSNMHSQKIFPKYITSWSGLKFKLPFMTTFDMVMCTAK